MITVSGVTTLLTLLFVSTIGVGLGVCTTSGVTTSLVGAVTVDSTGLTVGLSTLGWTCSSLTTFILSLVLCGATTLGSTAGVLGTTVGFTSLVLGTSTVLTTPLSPILVSIVPSVALGSTLFLSFLFFLLPFLLRQAN